MINSGQRISEYLLMEKIGEGGFGEVWKAKHHLLDELVAIKIPSDPEFVSQLRTEGGIQHRLKHGNIVQTLGLDPAADPPYCVMEYVPGTNLREYLRRGPLPYRESREIASQILTGLAFAHEGGVIHCDLKPENILVTPGPVPAIKISDFGLGRVTERVSASLYLSGQGKTSEGKGLSGTLEYMSPEQKKGQRLDARSDIYSFGLIFYEMLMGETPAGAFRWPSDAYPDVPGWVSGFLKRCLASSPADRFAHAREAFEELLRNSGQEARHRGAAFVFGIGVEIYSLRELVEMMISDAESARHHLYSGDLEPWLRSIRERDLSRQATRIREEESDQEIGVQRFLEATGLLAPPRMDLDVSEVELGEIARGETRAFRLHITRFGRGMLWGKAFVEGAPEFVTPSRVYFKGDRTFVEFTVATLSLSAGRTMDLSVRIESNGGSAAVPVRFRVGPRPAHLEVLDPELPLAGRGGARVSGPVRVRNSGDAPLSLSASWSEDWIEIDRLQDLSPGEEREIRIAVRMPKVQGPMTTRLTLVSNGGTRDIFLRLTPVRSMAPAGFILGLVVGAVPFIAELLGAILLLDALFGMFRPDSAPDRKNKLAFLAGLLPGAVWHLWLML